MVLNCSEAVFPRKVVCVKSNVSGLPSICFVSYLTCCLFFALIWLFSLIHNFTENRPPEIATLPKTQELHKKVFKSYSSTIFLVETAVTGRGVMVLN